MQTMTNAQFRALRIGLALHHDRDSADNGPDATKLTLKRPQSDPATADYCDYSGIFGRCVVLGQPACFSAAIPLFMRFRRFHNIHYAQSQTRFMVENCTIAPVAAALSGSAPRFHGGDHANIS